MRRLLVGLLLAGTLAAAKKPKAPLETFPVFRDFPGTCEALWPRAVMGFAGAGFDPVQSDRAGGIMGLAWRNGLVMGVIPADATAKRLTLVNRGFWDNYTGFRVDRAGAYFLQMSTECRVRISINYAAFDGFNWRVADTSGRMEAEMLDKLK